MSKLHAILSDLHRLLSTYEREDFLDASGYPGLGQPLKEALFHLASEARGDSKRSFPVRRDRASRRELGNAKADAPSQSSKAPLADLILSSEYGGGIASLISFAAGHGLKLEARPKESRERLAKRLAALVAMLPDSKRNLVSADLLGRVSSQTQGWINVIKGTKR
jgi:hypothetical protein